MPTNEELVKSIRQKLKSGYPDGELKNELLDKGYTEEMIGQLFFEASGHSHESRKTTTNKNSTTAIFNLVGVSLLITGITIMSADTWLKKYGIYLLIASGICFTISVINSISRKSNQ